MNRIYLLPILLLASCSNNNELGAKATKQNIDRQNTNQLLEKQKNNSQNGRIEPQVYRAWLGSYWGMSSEQLKNLFPLQQQSFDVYCPTGYVLKDCQRYELKKQLIGTYSYNINFNFIKNQLANINFVCNPDLSEEKIKYFEVEKCADEMEFLLKEKYGDYNSEDIKLRSGLGSKMGMKYEQTTTKKTWITDEKEIKYFYIDCSGECSAIEQPLLGYRKLSVSHTPDSSIFKVESEIYDFAKEQI